MAALVVDTLSTAISKVHFYAGVKTVHSSDYHRPSVTVATPEIAFKYFEICISTGNEDLVGAIIESLTNMTNVTPTVVQERVKSVLLPLLPSVNTLLKARPPGSTTIPGVEKLYKSTVKLYLGSSSTAVGPSKEDMKLLIEACKLYGGVDLLVNTSVLSFITNSDS